MMRKYLLDTHALIHVLGAPHKLGRKAHQALKAVEAGRAVAFVPAIVAAEVALLFERGRTSISVSELLVAVEDAPGLGFLPLDRAQVQDFVAHTAIEDPFDRLIISAARSTGSRLISKDQRITESGLVHVVWD